MTYRWWIFLAVVVVFAVAGSSNGVASATSQVPAATTWTATGALPHSALIDLGQRSDAAADVPSTQQSVIGARVADRMILVAVILFSALLTLFLAARVLVHRRARSAPLSGGVADADRGTIDVAGADTRQTAFAQRKTDISDPIHYRVAS